LSKLASAALPVVKMGVTSVNDERWTDTVTQESQVQNFTDRAALYFDGNTVETFNTRLV